MAAPRSLVAILLLSVVAANLVEEAVSLPEVSLSARKALNHGESAGLATTFEDAWSTLGDALKAAAQVLRGSPLIELWRNPSLTSDDPVSDIEFINQYREALKKDKIIIEIWQSWDGTQQGFQDDYFEFADRFPGIAFYRLSTTYHDDIVKEVGVRGIPSLVAFSHGKKYEEVVELNSDALGKLVQKLNAPLIESSRNPSLTNGEVTDIGSDDEYRKALEKEKIIIEFWIPEDGPQSYFQYVYAQYVDRFPGIAFYRINIRDFTEIAVKEVGIHGIPAFVAFSHGKKYEEVDGLNRDALDNLVQKLNALKLA